MVRHMSMKDKVKSKLVRKAFLVLLFASKNLIRRPWCCTLLSQNDVLLLISMDKYKQVTLASAAGLTFPFTAKAPPRRTICPIFLVNAGSNWIAYIKNINIVSNITNKPSPNPMLKDLENDQCNIRKGPQSHNSNFSRVEVSLLDKKLSG